MVDLIIDEGTRQKVTDIKSGKVASADFLKDWTIGVRYPATLLKINFLFMEGMKISLGIKVAEYPGIIIPPRY